MSDHDLGVVLGADGPGDPIPLAMGLGIGLLLLVAGVALAWIGLKGERGTLPLNWVAGIRTKATMASDEAWDAAHRAGGRLMTISGVVLAASAVPLFFRPSNAVAAVLILGSTGVVLVLAVWSTIRANRAARDVLDMRG